MLNNGSEMEKKNDVQSAHPLTVVDNAALILYVNTRTYCYYKHDHHGNSIIVQAYQLSLPGPSKLLNRRQMLLSE